MRAGRWVCGATGADAGVSCSREAEAGQCAQEEVGQQFCFLHALPVQITECLTFRRSRAEWLDAVVSGESRNPEDSGGTHGSCGGKDQRSNAPTTTITRVTCSGKAFTFSLTACWGAMEAFQKEKRLTLFSFEKKARYHGGQSRRDFPGKLSVREELEYLLYLQRAVVGLTTTCLIVNILYSYFNP